MSSKRKVPFGSLQRRVRPRREEAEPELNEYSDGSAEELESGGNGSSDEEHDETDESESASDQDEEEQQEDATSALTQVSFGALAKAQASLPNLRRKKSRRPTDDDSDQEEVPEDDNRHSRKPDLQNTKREKPTRASKHAPTEMTSKRPVTRKREVVTVRKPPPRDPRFSAASGPVDETRARKAYAFLDEYRDSEMATLKAAMRKTKNAEAKEELGKKLKSMQSRKEAQARKDKEEELLAKHRKSEKELVAQGKKPFYLKKNEQKEMLLKERFAGMKKKQVDKTIEKRRKKLASKEKRSMPMERRGAA
ncbi:hypothetical protein F5Y18DRAFT_397175 [Xylariaceae sp. FL1019]|nr:hypothetical protein F5Y18DRAFT_397175 [Xylariaceae sp. FL1019]